MSEQNPNNTNEEKKSTPPRCGCGRSPNGNCVGWHALSFEEYEYRKEMYEVGKMDVYGNNLK